MKSYFLFTSIILFTLLSACKKNKDNDDSGGIEQPPVSSSCTVPDPIDMAGAASFGDGTPASITQQRLQELINTGGKIIFNGGDQPVTLKLTATLTVPNKEVIIDGGGLLTFDGDNKVRIFRKLSAANQGNGSLFGLQRCKLINGYTNNTDELGGAAIYGATFGSLRVHSVTFDRNQGPLSDADACGAVHTVLYKEASFVNCTFTNNKGANGGAVGTIGSGSTFINCDFINNEATGTGGTFSNGGSGGAVYDDGVDQNGANNTFTLCGCRFIGNKAAHQGGGANIIFYHSKGSTCSINNCSFEDNSSAVNNGGGLYYMNGSLTLSNSTFYNNSAKGAGGGMWTTLDGNASSAITMSIYNVSFNKNISGNGTASGLGGGLWMGGEINADVKYSTFAENKAGLFASALFNGANLTLTNNLFYKNLTGSSHQGNSDAGATINKGSKLTIGPGNLQFPRQFTSVYGTRDEDWVNASVISEDAQLGPLSANGGFVKTMALPAGSPAIGKAAPQSIKSDARGKARKSAPDIGAYESE